jgi:hypothetical protein
MMNFTIVYLLEESRSSGTLVRVPLRDATPKPRPRTDAPVWRKFSQSRSDFLADATARCGAAMWPSFAATHRRNISAARLARFGPRAAGAAKFEP